MLYNEEWDRYLVPDLDKPSLKALSYTLRHRETWPPNFKWNFGFCPHCAMGLAHQLWNVPIRDYNNSHNLLTMTSTFNISAKVYEDIFLGKGRWSPKLILDSSFVAHAKITPEMVADQIDKYLAGE